MNRRQRKKRALRGLNDIELHFKKMLDSFAHNVSSVTGLTVKQLMRPLKKGKRPKYRVVVDLESGDFTAQVTPLTAPTYPERRRPGCKRY